MSENIFTDIPQIELLQWLGRGSLKQNLLRSIRLWVCLRSFYGEGQERLVLKDGFTLADWKNAFFSSTHPKGEAIPQIHDLNCPCSKTTADWLFNDNTGLTELEWKRSLLAHLAISPHQHNTSKNNHNLQSVRDLDRLLQQRLFAVTRRSLQADLELLAKLGWLKYHDGKYYLVHQLPSRPITGTRINTDELNFLNQEDLAEIVRHLSQKIAGVQRFFFQLDYVVTAIDEVEQWQDQLKQIWENTPVPPIKLLYDSARLGKSVECCVYPVCIYYVQRAVYLCAFGQSPDRKTDWYNYRLDRIQEMIPITWIDADIPPVLQKRYQKRDLPSPEEIELQMSKAWGFDFYLESRLMLLRFEREHHERYIKDSFRHDTFEAVSYREAKRLICRYTPEEQQQALIQVLAARASTDAYYKVNYRHGDNNVIMRLRAWRPKVEVLMPGDLRQSIASDITKEIQLYRDLLNL